MTITQDEHFISREILPVIMMDTSLQATLKILFDTGSGGFIIADDIYCRFYLAGDSFADFVDGQLTYRPELLATSLVSVLLLTPADGVWHSELTLPEPGLVPVTTAFLDPKDRDARRRLAESPENLAAPVVDQRGKLLGWYLNHETVARTVHTRPPTYVCSIDDRHRFADPDHNKCSYCPGSLSRLR